MEWFAFKKRDHVAIIDMHLLFLSQKKMHLSDRQVTCAQHYRSFFLNIKAYRQQL